MCAFIPKCHWLPFFVWCISGSLALSLFFVEGGAAMIVASTMVPRDTFRPFASRYSHTRWNIRSPSACASSRCRNLHTVVSSGAPSRPKSIPTNRRRLAMSYNASSHASSARLNQCYTQHPQHPLKTHRRVASVRLRAMRFDLLAQRRPWHQRIHRPQKLVTARRLRVARGTEISILGHRMGLLFVRE